MDVIFGASGASGAAGTVTKILNPGSLGSFVTSAAQIERGFGLRMPVDYLAGESVA